MISKGTFLVLRELSVCKFGPVECIFGRFNKYSAIQVMKMAIKWNFKAAFCGLAAFNLPGQQMDQDHSEPGKRSRAVGINNQVHPTRK